MVSTGGNAILPVPFGIQRLPQDLVPCGPHPSSERSAWRAPWAGLVHKLQRDWLCPSNRGEGTINRDVGGGLEPLAHADHCFIHWQDAYLVCPLGSDGPRRMAGARLNGSQLALLGTDCLVSVGTQPSQ